MKCNIKIRYKIYVIIHFYRKNANFTKCNIIKNVILHVNIYK